jgi:glycosyltransferase involved in cell wall biosynthesis
MNINIIGRDNGVGLSKDLNIIKSLAIECGHNIVFSDFSKSKPAERFDLNIYLELLHSKWFSKASSHWLIPNPEWYDVRWKQFLPRFSRIICKTRSAISEFSKYNKKTFYTSFTSENCFDPSIQKDESKWLHVAGKSLQKSTNVIYDTWQQNPNFPHLTIIQDPSKYQKRDILPNLDYRYERIDDKELSYLQNHCGVHLCPSETEGFGHYIMEAMSCRALIITTNAPPMNELVDESRGILCNFEYKRKNNFAFSHYVSPKNLKEAVIKAVNTDNLNRERYRNNGQRFFESNDLFFKEEMKKLLSIHKYAQPLRV